MELVVHNDSVVALACGTGGPLHGCVLIVGTGESNIPQDAYMIMSATRSCQPGLALAGLVLQDVPSECAYTSMCLCKSTLGHMPILVRTHVTYEQS